MYVGLNLIRMLKILPIIPSRTSQNFDPLFPSSSPIVPTYSCNFYCISDNNVHNIHSDYYTGEQNIASTDFSYEILLPS